MSKSEIRNNDIHNDRLWAAIDRLAVIASIVIVAFLSYVYFQLPKWSAIPELARGFLMAVIANIIPVYILFMVSFFLFREIQKSRDRESSRVLAKQISEYLQESYRQDNAFPSQDEGVDLWIPNKELQEALNEKSRKLSELEKEYSELLSRTRLVKVGLSQDANQVHVFTRCCRSVAPYDDGSGQNRGATHGLAALPTASGRLTGARTAIPSDSFGRTAS